MDYLDEEQRVERTEDGHTVVWAMVRFIQGRGEVTFPVQLIAAVREALRSKPNKAERGRAVLDAIAQFLPASVLDDDALPSFVIAGPKPAAPRPSVPSFTLVQSATSVVSATTAVSAREPSVAVVRDAGVAGAAGARDAGASGAQEPSDPLHNQVLEPLGFNPQMFGRLGQTGSAEGPKAGPMRVEKMPAAVKAAAPAAAPKPTRADLAALQAKYDRLLSLEPPLIYEAYEVKRQMMQVEQKLLALGL